MAVTVKFLADVANWVAGLGKSEAAVEDNAEALEDLMRQVIELGTRAGLTSDQIADDFSKAFGVPLDRAKAAVAEVQSGTGQLGDTAAEAGTAVDDGISTGAKGAGASMSELGEIARSVLAGDVTGAAEAAGEAIGALGPIAGAVGLVVSAVVGIAAAAASEAQEKLAATREGAAQLAATLYENGGKLPLQDAVDDLLESLTTEVGAGTNPLDKLTDQFRDYGDVLDAVRTSAKLTGGSTGDLLRGLSGRDVDQARRQIEALDDAIASVGDRGNRMDVFRIADESRKLTDVRDRLQQVVDEADLASGAVGAIQDEFAAITEAQARNADAIAAEQAHIEELGGAWQDAMVDASTYFSTTEEGAQSFDWGAYLADAEQTIADADAYKRAIVGLPDSIQEEGERVFADSGATAAKAYVEAYTTASDADKARFETVAAANGTAAGTAQGTALASAARTSAQGLLDIMGPINMLVKPTVDRSPIDTFLWSLQSTRYINVQARMTNALSPTGRFGTDQDLG